MQRIVIACFVVWVGCAGDGVGDPCVPDSVPPGGFEAAETYVETSSSACLTRVCLVRHLDGDPSPSCVEDCPTEAEIEETTYCSCRCDEGAASPCACPTGFECAMVGPEGYCVRGGA